MDNEGQCAECGTRSSERTYAKVPRESDDRTYTTTLCDQCIDDAMDHFAGTDTTGVTATEWNQIPRTAIERSAAHIRAEAATE